MSSISLSELTKSIVSEFVTHPDKLNIIEKAGKASIIIGINSTEKEDIAQIIGKNGHTILAIKNLLERIANKRGIRCTVYVID